MLLLLGTLGLIEWLAIVGFFLLLTAATFFDRRTIEGPKWYLIGATLIGTAIYFWPDFTFFGPAHVDAVMGTGAEAAKVITKAHDRVVLWPIVSDWTFWQPVLVYLGVGLAYSCFEFWLVIRKAARSLGAAWAEFTAKTRSVPAFGADGEALFIERDGKQVPSTVTVTYGELIRTARSQGATYRYFQNAVDLVKDFVMNPDRFNWKGRQETQIIGIIGSADKLSAEPKIDKLELAEHAGAWTFLWPAYLLSLILGDLIVEIFNVVADFLVSISGRFVKFAFRDVFKV